MPYSSAADLRREQFWWAQFRFCPRCGAEYREDDFHEPWTSFRCPGCGYEFFQNSSPATTSVLPSKTNPNEIVLLTRSTDPGRNLLGLPGGFLQYHEDPDNGAVREVSEELGFRAEVDRLLDAYLVNYKFRGALVSVVELVFLCKPIDRDVRGIRSSEAKAVDYYDVSALLESPERLAFPEQQQALRRYRQLTGF